MNYVIWGHSPDPTLCSLSPPERIEEAYELNYGVSRARNFSSDAVFRMDPEFKKAIKLADALDNASFLIVASRRLKDFLEKEKVPDTEYLRVSILNHKNRLASDDYYIIHQVGAQNCIDLNQSIVKWNLINPDQISSIKKLVIDESAIGPNATLFRVKALPSIIFVRRDLADKLEKAGFTGIQFKEIATYREV
ncbi:MAG: hypothetical protein L0Z68_02785 [Gammaproteobacteria bacterium]|nr:hypothetical protein [Gammaproteobacteria bacterium]